MAAAAGIIVGGIHYIHKYTLFLLELFAYYIVLRLWTSCRKSKKNSMQQQYNRIQQHLWYFFSATGVVDAYTSPIVVYAPSLVSLEPSANNMKGQRISRVLQIEKRNFLRQINGSMIKSSIVVSKQKSNPKPQVSQVEFYPRPL